MTLAGFVYPV